MISRLEKQSRFYFCVFDIFRLFVWGSHWEIYGTARIEWKWFEGWASLVIAVLFWDFLWWLFDLCCSIFFFFHCGFFVVCFLVFYFFWFVGVYSNVVGICLFLCCVCSLLLGDIRVVSDIVNQRFSFLSDSHFRGWGLRWQWACIRHRESTGYGFEAW